VLIRVVLIWQNLATSELPILQKDVLGAAQIADLRLVAKRWSTSGMLIMTLSLRWQACCKD